MNRGDTSFLMLNYTINGDPLSEGEYQEIELTINAQPSSRCIQKKLSNSDIVWGTLTYTEGETEKTFTGYYTHLDQDETFKLSQGTNEVQIRILDNNEVGSSAISSISLGQVLSNEVLNGNT